MPCRTCCDPSPNPTFRLYVAAREPLVKTCRVHVPTRDERVKLRNHHVCLPTKSKVTDRRPFSAPRGSRSTASMRLPTTPPAIERPTPSVSPGKSAVTLGGGSLI